MKIALEIYNSIKRAKEITNKLGLHLSFTDSCWTLCNGDADRMLEEGEEEILVSGRTPGELSCYLTGLQHGMKIKSTTPSS